MKPKLDLAPMLDRLKFALATAGWPSLAGLFLLLVGTGAELLVVPQQRALAAGKLGSAQALAQFRARLNSEQDADAVFEILQREAQKNGLAPNGTEYKWQRQSGAGLAEVSIVMPMKAAYAPLRAFVKDVLADVPGLALDQFDLQREAIGAGVVDARLRFSLYLKVGR
jgi:hypothetical protein